jgi:hypothetical protein
MEYRPIDHPVANMITRVPRGKAEGNYEGIEVHDYVEKALNTGGKFFSTRCRPLCEEGKEKAGLEVRLERRFPLRSKQGET